MNVINDNNSSSRFDTPEDNSNDAGLKINHTFTNPRNIIRNSDANKSGLKPNSTSHSLVPENEFYEVTINTSNLLVSTGISNDADRRHDSNKSPLAVLELNPGKQKHLEFEASTEYEINHDNECIQNHMDDLDSPGIKPDILDPSSDLRNRSQAQIGNHDCVDGTEISNHLHDNFDQDPEFLALVEYLADLFPKVNRTELKLLLKTTDNLDELVESLFIEDETSFLAKEEEEVQANLQKSVKYSPAVYTLKDMFPDHDPDVLQSLLDKHGGDLQLASTDLLSGNVSDKKAKRKLPARSPRNQWNALQDSANKLQELLGISNAEAISYLHANQRKFPETLVDIIKRHRKTVQVSKDTGIPLGGRVQRTRTGDTRLSRRTRNGNQSKPELKAEQEQELINFFNSNIPVQEIGYEFLVKLHEYFEGDLVKVVSLCQYVIDNDIAYMIPKLMNKVEYKPEIKLKKPEITKIFDTDSNKVSALTNASRNTNNNDELESFILTGKLDLHGLNLAHALQLTRQVLNYWWNKELDSRINEGRLTRYGSKAEFAGTVEIVTGRGIHSVNGVSILKQEVSKYLTRNNYLFNEGVGKFEVYGRKKNN